MSAHKYIHIGDLPLTYPKVTPEDGVTDYKISKIEVKQPRFNNATWEVSRDCAKISLFEAKQFRRKRSELLRNCRRTAVIKRNIFDAKWQELEMREDYLKMMFKRFNQFVRENQEKRERAEKKILDEVELQRKRTDDIETMKDDYAQMSNIKNLMEKKIKEHRMYEDYLQAIVKATQSIKHLNELIYRYESLIETKNILCDRQQTSLLALELARANMMKLIEDKTLVLVGLQNQLANLQERYDLAYAKSLQWESNVGKIQDVCGHESAMAHLVRCSIDETYAAMCRRKNAEPSFPADDYRSKLAFISKTLAELPKVLTRIRAFKRNRYIL